jgi:hypothetical protein
MLKSEEKTRKNQAEITSKKEGINPLVSLS